MEQHSHPHNDRHLPLPLAAPQASGGRDRVKPQAANSCCVQTNACTDWNSGAGLFDFKWMDSLLNFILGHRVTFSLVMADARIRRHSSRRKLETRNFF